MDQNAKQSGSILKDVPCHYDPSVPISMCVVGGFNPASRTLDTQALASLLQSCGRQVQPVTLVRLPDGSLLQVDGYRRIDALKKLGEKFVSAMVWEAGENWKEVYEVLFGQINSATRAWKGNDQVGVGLSSGVVMSPGAGRTVEFFKEIFDGEVPTDFQEGRAGTGLAFAATSTVKYCQPKLKKHTAGYRKACKLVIVWMNKNHTQLNTLRYRKLSFAPGILWNAILRDSQTVPKFD